MTKMLVTTPSQSFQAIFERCRILRERSDFLRREGRQLCTTSRSLRDPTTILALEMGLIEAAGFFIVPEVDDQTGEVVLKLRRAATPPPGLSLRAL